MFFVEVTKFINNCDLIGKKKNSNLFPINSAADVPMFDLGFSFGYQLAKIQLWLTAEIKSWPNIFINLITSNLIKEVMMVNKELKINSEIMTNRRLDYFPLQHMARFLHVCAYLFLKALNMFDYGHILDKSEFVINIVPQIFLFSVCL